MRDSRDSPSSEALTSAGLSLNSVAMTSSDFASCVVSIVLGRRGQVAEGVDRRRTTGWSGCSGIVGRRFSWPGPCGSSARYFWPSSVLSLTAAAGPGAEAGGLGDLERDQHVGARPGRRR